VELSDSARVFAGLHVDNSNRRARTVKSRIVRIDSNRAIEIMGIVTKRTGRGEKLTETVSGKKPALTASSEKAILTGR